MPLAVDSPPVLYPRSPFLTFGTSSFMHIGSICAIYIAADGTFGLVCILSMIGPQNSTMPAALLAVRIEVANFYRLADSVLPLNLHIDIVHIDLPSQSRSQGQPGLPLPLLKIIFSNFTTTCQGGADPGCHLN